MVKVIKDKPKSKADVISYMENKYPKMTSEFKKIQKEQYELFLRNNTIMVHKILQLVLH